MVLGASVLLCKILGRRGLNQAPSHKNFHTLYLTKHEYSDTHKTKMLKNKDISCFQILICCIYHANKLCYFMSMLNFMLSCFEHDFFFDNIEVKWGFEHVWPIL